MVALVGGAGEGAVGGVGTGFDVGAGVGFEGVKGLGEKLSALVDSVFALVDGGD